MIKSIALIMIAALSSFGALAQEKTQNDGLKVWAKIYEVFSHPRCANCHVGENNRPKWSGPSYEKAYNLPKGGNMYHAMYINAGNDRTGAKTTPCATCHQHRNDTKPHSPPGNDVWFLPPVEMEWFGKSSSYICQQIQDPERNGNRTLAEISKHIEHDELVHWGWNPGPGRQPAPYSSREVARFIKSWQSAGAPCPIENANDISTYLETPKQAEE